MDPVLATRFQAPLRAGRKFRPDLLPFAFMTANTGVPGTSSDVRTASRGSHWIGWVAPAGSDKPEGSIVLIGKTREEAEERARAWLNSTYRWH
jgi:hypothetical protein